ncbi:MAG: AAA family ATPase [Candidatus Mcinerneyibacterium aminivorans]|uniref:AAA family ATPase n=1 Tax=Candidatus Mcinerneyibacterium aminivorans TaxID=2703815 RepID=A0A5D0MH77_9BACT|nr:MAG: AAA family ATPase [Candidatus Mcinerneyibacterium aminivorans]
MVSKIKTLPIKESELDQFVNRENEINYILGLLRSFKNCAISGNKGIGKTSFLNLIKNKIEEDFSTIFISAPSLDKTYFYRKLMNQIISKKYEYNFEETKKKLRFSQQIETLAKLLLKGENIGEIQEQKVFNFISSLVDENKNFKKNLLSTEQMHDIIYDFFCSLNEKVFIFVDDIDKITIDKLSKNNKIYNFLIELSDLLNLDNITWIFSINKKLHTKIENDLMNNESNSIFSFLNDLINLEYFSVKEFKKILFKRINKEEINNYTNSALRMIFAIAKGNPRLLMYMLIKTLKYKKINNYEKVDEKTVINTVNNIYSIDKKSSQIMEYISKKSFIFPGDKTLQQITKLDSVSLNMRLKELVNKNLITSEIVNKKKAYWLSYIHDESILKGVKE